MFSPVIRRLGLAVLALVALAQLLVAPPAQAADDFLDPSAAFRFSARAVDAHSIEVRYQIADGYYLYRERFKFSVQAPATLGDAVFPQGEIKFDENFGKNVEHYRKEVRVLLPVTGSGPIQLTSVAQGCADAGLCYPPQTAQANIALPAALALPAPAAAVKSRVAPVPAAVSSPDPVPMTVAPVMPAVVTPAPAPAVDESSRLAATLSAGSLPAIASIFFVLGLLLSLTPCVLPMLPILSSIIVGQHAGSQEHLSRWRGFSLALAYSEGMALVYTALGIAAGLAGQGLAAFLQNAWVLGAFSGLLVLFAFSMFGFYELQMPNAVQTRLSAWSGNSASGKGFARLAGVFVMGAISALIVGPCVAAPLAGALLYISQTRNVVIGGVALFALAQGMSVPLLLLGLSARTLLPRAGGWMESVKRFFGALLIAVAIWMVSPVLPAWALMLAWAALLIISAAYLHVFDSLPHDASGWRRLWKGIGVLLFLAGAVELVGVATGGRDVLQPLGNLAARANATASESAHPAVAFERIHSNAELDARLHNANRPVMLDFYADWCVSCKEMERLTYPDARISAKMQGYLLLQADVTANSADDQALMKRFNLFGPPGILFFDQQGSLVNGARVVGFQNADTFLATLAQVGH